MNLSDLLQFVRFAWKKYPYISTDVAFKWTGYTGDGKLTFKEKKKMPPKWIYFTDEEVVGLDPEFVAMLDRARGLARTPFVITSGLRTPLQNESTPNAVSDSAHLSGLAVDLACSGSQERYQIIKALLAVGLCRLGIYEKHIHTDADTTKPQNVIWYVNGV